MTAMTLQSRLVTARQQARLTQVDVARKLGRPQSFISKTEMGEIQRPRFIDVVRLARIYGKPLAYFALAVEE